jgi:hypothetical protein
VTGDTLAVSQLPGAGNPVHAVDVDGVTVTVIACVIAVPVVGVTVSV